jgi:hypothetical protein
MSQASVVTSVLKQCKLTDADKDAVEASLVGFVYDLLSSYEWSFRLKNHTDTTTATTHDYTLKGASNDCAQVVDIYYDDANPALSYYYPREFDRRTYGTDPVSQLVSMWTNRGEDVQGFPQIELSGNTDAGKDLYYSYLCKIDESDPWALLPVAMQQIAIEYGIAQFHPDAQVRSEKYSHVYGDDRKSGLIANARRRWRLRSLTTTQGRIDEQKRQRNREISLGSHSDRLLYTGD